MTLADTGKAIGSVTRLLRDFLINRTNLNITIGRPGQVQGTGPRLNLFLYEAQFDPSLKSIPFDEGQPFPLWLVLKYLMTPFDKDENSDTDESHDHLGEGIRALKEASFLLPTPFFQIEGFKALCDNPEVLKITFDNISADLVSKLMQGPDEKYRFSIGFEIKPVMIATDEPASNSLLVGVDYTANQVIGEKGITIPVISSTGPIITQIFPSKFEVGDILTITGSDLNLSDLSVCIGQTELDVTSQQPDKLQCSVKGAIESGRIISAGSHIVSVAQILPTGRRRSSNALVGELLPTLTSVTPNKPFTVIPATSNDLVVKVYGNIVMTGTLLGGEKDDILVALYQGGKTVRVFDRFTASQDQSTLTLAILQSQAIPPGKYRIILRVNGQQARNSPEVDLS